MAKKTGLELQLSAMGSRAKLHALIDELPDDGEALIIYHYPNPDQPDDLNKEMDEALMVHGYVRLNVERKGDIVFMLERFKFDLFHGDYEDEDDA